MRDTSVYAWTQRARLLEATGRGTAAAEAAATAAAMRAQAGGA